MGVIFKFPPKNRTDSIIFLISFFIMGDTKETKLFTIPLYFPVQFQQHHQQSSYLGEMLPQS